VARKRDDEASYVELIGAPVRAIQRTICQRLGIETDALLSHRRHASLVDARHQAIWLTRATTRLSSIAVGQLFQRDHATVLYAAAQIASKMKQDPRFAKRMERQRDRLLRPTKAPD
jgi:chromosomal replication initiator protein